MTTNSKVNVTIANNANSDNLKRENNDILKEIAMKDRALAMRSYIEKKISEEKIEYFFFREDNTTVLHKDDSYIVQIDFSTNSVAVADRAHLQFMRERTKLYLGFNAIVDTSTIDKYEKHVKKLKKERCFVFNTDAQLYAFVDEMCKQYSTKAKTDSAKKKTAKKDSTSAKSKTSAKSSKTA